MLSSPTRFALAAVLAVAWGAAPALAQEEGTAAAEGEDPVVATVNGTEIHRSDVVARIGQLPPQLQQMPAEFLIPALAEEMAIGRLVSGHAREAGLAEDPEVQQRVEDAESRILQEVWLQRRVEERMTDEAVQEGYEAYLEQNPPQEEVNASHILVESREQAEEVVAQLEEGADFAELAQEHSIGPSGEQGGELGWFTRDQMVPEFADAAFALEPGTYTTEPVETQFGWHVIQVQDRRTAEPPPLEEVREEIESGLARQYVADIVEELRADAEIVIYGPDGEPLPQTPQEQPTGEQPAQE
jgi:peptidyl-prolyl cis-trans isomerase C